MRRSQDMHIAVFVVLATCSVACGGGASSAPGSINGATTPSGTTPVASPPMVPPKLAASPQVGTPPPAVPATAPPPAPVPTAMLDAAMVWSPTPQGTNGPDGMDGPDAGEGPDPMTADSDGSSMGEPNASGDMDPDTYQPCPPAGTPCKILPFGDSITDGVGYPGGGGYRIRLFERAVADGKRITYVGSLSNGPNTVANQAFPRQHEGHSGWKIDALRGLVPRPAFNNVPHIVLLMIGTNDVTQNDNLSQAPARLGALLDAIAETAPAAMVVVAKVIPMSYDMAKTQAYNAGVEKVVRQRADAGRHVMTVDMYMGFPTSELSDAVHPDQQGYARMGDTWYTAIEPLLPR